MPACALVVAFSLFAPPAAAPVEPKPLVFGVLPAVDAGRMQSDHAVLVDELQKALGRPIRLLVADDYQDILHKLIDGEVNLALLSPYMYVGIKSDVQKDVLVQRRMADADSNRGVCVVKASSPFKTLADLAGKRVAYVHLGSTSGHFYPRIELRKQGIDPAKHFASRVFAGSHDAVLAAVDIGTADLGCLSARTVAAAKGVRVLVRTEPIPDDVIIARQDVSEAERQKLRSFFLGAAQNPKLKAAMEAQKVAAYVEPDVSVYTAIEQEMQRP